MLWRFSFTSSSNVDVLLSRDVPPTVEELMDDGEILNECKSQNNKLVSYLSRDDSVKCLLQWVVAGLNDLDHQAVLAGNASFDHAVASPLFPSYRSFASTSSLEPIPQVPAPGLNSPPLEPAKQDAENHDVPSDELNSPDPSRGIGLGEGLENQQNGDSEGDRSRYPQIATEILTSELWTISETIMSNKDTLLRPFWDAVLPPIDAGTTGPYQPMSRSEESERERARDQFWSDKDEERDRKREMVRGMWTRVNCSLMMKRTHEMVRFIQSIPNVVDRIMAHIDSPAIQDMLVKIVSAEEAGVTGVVSWLADEGLISRLLALLSPGHSTNTHSIASELLKAIITLCAPAPFNPAGGNILGQPGGQEDQATGTRDNRMIRELVSNKSLSTMIGFMLDEIDLSDKDWPGLNGPDGPPHPADPFVVHPLPSVASAASSLSHICNILVEIIRRNNSDFSEPHLFHTLRQRLMILQGQESPGSGELHDAKVRQDMEEALQELSAKMGIVHLGDLILLVSSRFGELHRLLRHPRSQLRVASEQTPRPLTLERSRLVELYAELLHSSNMSTMNRAAGKGPVYTVDGILSGGLEGLEALGEAIEGDRGDDISDDGSVEDHVTKAKELPVSTGSTDCSLASSEVNSDDEAMLENVDDTPSQSPTLAHQTPLPPPLSQADDERLRVVRDMDHSISSAATSEMGAVSHAAVAATTIAPSLASEQADVMSLKGTSLSPGDRLKQMYIDHSVLPTVVDLFFEYPNNNFMHHVVYDILQQILNGRLGPGLNRQLVIELICRARLVERILDAQRLNDEAVKRPRSPRLPFMGHVVLIADELVKFFARCPPDLRNIISPSFVQSEWEAFVERDLRETKERDAASLAGGKPVAEAAAAAAAAAAAEAKDAEEDTSSDEEEPKFGEPLRRTVATDGFANRGSFDADDDDDEFWTAQAAGRRQVDSSDDDDDDADWLRPSSMNIHGGSDDEDFGGFQGKSGAGDDVDDDGWGSFSPSSDYGDNPFGDDNFAPSVTPGPSSTTFVRPQPLTPQDWKSEFEREFGNNLSPSIVVPNLGDDEADGEEEHVGGFGESTRSGVWVFRGDEDGGEDLPPASSPRSEGIPEMGRPISSTAVSVSAPAVPSADPPSPITIPTRAREEKEAMDTSPASSPPRQSPAGVSLGDIARLSLSNGGHSFSPPDPTLLEAATKEEPFGPGVSPDAHITLDGMLEKEVDGHMVAVPQDEIVRSVEDGRKNR